VSTLFKQDKNFQDTHSSNDPVVQSKLPEPAGPNNRISGGIGDFISSSSDDHNIEKLIQNTRFKGPDQGMIVGPQG
jgi:hypothetical protein